MMTLSNWITLIWMMTAAITLIWLSLNAIVEKKKIIEFLPFIIVGTTLIFIAIFAFTKISDWRPHAFVQVFFIVALLWMIRIMWRKHVFN